jgi:hypothetical protein
MSSVKGALLHIKKFCQFTFRDFTFTSQDALRLSPLPPPVMAEASS